MFFLLVILIVTQNNIATAQNCDNLSRFNEFVEKGKARLDSGDFIQAIQYFYSAKDYCQSSSTVIDKLLLETSHKIENQLSLLVISGENISALFDALDINTHNYHSYFYNKADSSFRVGDYGSALRDYTLADKSFDKPKNINIERNIVNAIKCRDLQKKAYELLLDLEYEQAERMIDTVLLINPNAYRSLLIANALNPNKYGLVKVKGGSFLMGNNEGNIEERPEHIVSLDDFEIGAFEVTNLAYTVFLNRYGSNKVKQSGKLMVDNFPWGVSFKNGKWIVTEDKNSFLPIVMVTWYGAQEFCNFYGGCLPSEAQWEYASRGGGKEEKRYKYAGSDDLEIVGWYIKNSGATTKPVGLKKNNSLGLYDMSGNVWEWCLDDFESRFYRSNEAQRKNPININQSTSNNKIARGGAWSSENNLCTVSTRNDTKPDDPYHFFGFRYCKKL